MIRWIILEAQQINLTIGFNKHNFKTGLKGRLVVVVYFHLTKSCCCYYYNDYLLDLPEMMHVLHHAYVFLE